MSEKQTEFDKFYQPRIKMTGGTQIELQAGEDTLILTGCTLNELRRLLNMIDDDNIRHQINGSVWKTVDNINNK